jgi:hypothetical protein
MATYRVIVSLEIEADDAEDAAAEAMNIVTDNSMVIESIAPMNQTPLVDKEDEKRVPRSQHQSPPLSSAHNGPQRSARSGPFLLGRYEATFTCRG